jgi:hypothetical protein
VFIYPWDLADEGFASVLHRVRDDIGLSGLTIAVSYHAAKLLLPHNPKRRVFFAEDGALYFQPGQHAFANSALRPRIAAGAAPNAAAAADAARGAGLRVTAWMVCLHNTWLGTRYPGSAVRNAFGDVYPFSLCPSRDEVRDYLCTVLEEMLAVVRPDAVEFESPGFLPFTHGFHHEIQNVALTPAAELLLSLCFCEACQVHAEPNLKSRVSTALESFFAGADDACDDVPGVADYLLARSRVVTSLLARLSGIARTHDAEPVLITMPTVVDWPCGIDLRAPENGLQAVDVAHYSADCAGVENTINGLKAELPANVRVYAVVRPGHPDCEGAEQLAAKIAALRRSGVEQISFYNYGLMRECEFEWIAQALDTAQETRA